MKRPAPAAIFKPSIISFSTDMLVSLRSADDDELQSLIRY
ncbi:hypothetical protein D777_02168 [Marinobacter nitratireducens]|uniref:Uncharacterized protein n=1 Tax=Marinobacter nitratireducens TaxID=1137280 RepID=A0A072ND38_9GAMM|nr:hypothetical protein D777_02168 [Marinobacter nitratireducens]